MMIVNILDKTLLVTAAFSNYEGILTVSPCVSTVDGNGF